MSFWDKLQQETELLKEGNILVVDNLISNGNYNMIGVDNMSLKKSKNEIRVESTTNGRKTENETHQAKTISIQHKWS